MTPASAIRRFFAACMAFTLSVAPAFAQEAEDEKGVFDQVDAAAGWVVDKIGGVFFYPIWTFDKVGDQVKEVKIEAGGNGYVVGDVVLLRVEKRQMMPKPIKPSLRSKPSTMAKFRN